MQINHVGTPEEKTDAAVQKDKVITFLHTASPGDIDDKVEQIFTESATQIDAAKTIFKIILKWMAWATRKILRL